MDLSEEAIYVIQSDDYRSISLLQHIHFEGSSLLDLYVCKPHNE